MSGKTVTSAAREHALERWRRRARFWAVAATVQLLALLVLIVLQRDLHALMRGVLDLVSMTLYATFLVFLIVVFLRYIVLVALSFLELQRPTDVDVGGPLPRVSVIVPAYNEEAVIRASIRSLVALDYGPLEVLVVDDGSKDGTYAAALEVARDAPPGRVRVLTKPNSGKANALNHGITAARSELVLCVDADSKLEPDALQHMVRPLMADPTLGAVAGAVKVANRDGLLTKMQAIEYIQGLNLVRRAMSWGSIVNIIPGPIGLFRREALLSVGLYDDDTFAEDCDVTLQLLMKGWKIHYVAEGKSWTEAPESLRDLFQQRYRWTRGILQAVMKHREQLDPRKQRLRLVNLVVLLYMLFEAIAWPVMNVAAHVFLIVLTYWSGVGSLLILWWCLLVTLDLSSTLLTLSMEEEDLRLLPYTLVYRTFFSLAVDVCKLAATIEELLGVGMDWGKLARAGRI